MNRFLLAAACCTVTLAALAGVPAGGPAPAKAHTVAAVLAADGRLGIVARALQASGFHDTLAIGEGWTLFVPSDEALRNEGSAFLLEDVLLTPANAGRLKEVVGHHLTRGVAPARSASRLRSVSGTTLLVDRVGNGLRIDGHAVVVERIDAGNGTIYVVDRMLWPAVEAVGATAQWSTR
jgi:uncharacterized surface protein with fasciclin (FAS1) repeats